MEIPSYLSSTSPLRQGHLLYSISRSPSRPTLARSRSSSHPSLITRRSARLRSRRPQGALSARMQEVLLTQMLREMHGVRIPASAEDLHMALLKPLPARPQPRCIKQSDTEISNII